MQFFSAETINENLDFPTLIDTLADGFRSDIEVPQRMHIDYPGPKPSDTNTLLLMPAIRIGDYAGVKIVNVAPGNRDTDFETIQGIYYLMDATTGVPVALFDAKSITVWRTAAASALASRFLSRADARKLLILGTGALAPYLVRAHAAARPIEDVLIYGRSGEKAHKMADELKGQFRVEVIEYIDEHLSSVDIVSAATSSPGPLIRGELLKEGQHIDLVGAYTPTTRESDDKVMKRGRIFADNRSSVLKEAGDLLIPIESGAINGEDIVADLFELCQAKKSGRAGDGEITVFKSVGHAMEDLVTAIHLYKKLS